MKLSAKQTAEIIIKEGKIIGQESVAGELITLIVEAFGNTYRIDNVNRKRPKITQI